MTGATESTRPIDRVQLEAILDEQRAAWDSGDRPSAEAFLAHYPALLDDAEAAVDLIYHEFLIRRSLGESPDPAEFLGRFPDWSDALLGQLAVDQAMRTATQPTIHLAEDGASPDPGSDDPVPSGAEPGPSIDGYELLEELGRGATGVVYKARERRLNRLVALKTISESAFSSPAQRRRFLAEAEAIARVRHPHIIPIHAVGEERNRPYISLEYAEGGSLARRLAGGPMPARDAAGLVEALARAVEAAHRAGVVHRDLKPGNVLLAADGAPKVADFGLARLLGEESSRTTTGEVLGTPSYMAPEQAEGRSREAGPAADIYALGAILYHALTGRPPFLGASAMETLRLVVSAEVVPPRRQRPDVPRDLETIALKCLEKEPDRRYTKALELADDLARFRNGEPIRARPIGVVGRTEKWARRHPWQSASAAIAALAITSILGLTYRHNLQLRAQVARTEAKTAEARRNYREARSTIEAMLKRLNDHRFAGTPRLKELGRDQTEDARDFYHRILSQNDSRDTAVRFDNARTFEALSRIQYELGLRDQAEKQVRQALELVKGLRAEDPDNVTYLRLQVGSLMSLAAYLRDTGRADEALSASEEALDLAGRRAGAMLDDPSDQAVLAYGHTHHANTLRTLRRPDEAPEQMLKRLDGAREHLDKALEIYERLKSQGLERAGLLDLAMNHAATLVDHGTVLWNLGQGEPAHRRFVEAEKIMRDLPGERLNLNTLIALYVNWSGLLETLRRFDEAIARADEGLRRVEPRLRAEPSDVLALSSASNLHGNRALAFQAQDKRLEAFEEWKRHLECLPTSLPNAYRLSAAITVARAGAFDPALDYTRLIESKGDLDPADWYNIACVHSVIAEVARKDPHLSADQQETRYQAGLSEAFKYLKKAAEAGFFRNVEMRRKAREDEDLRALHKLPEFDAILESGGSRQGDSLPREGASDPSSGRGPRESKP
jgi:tetratricopeptide (TPR) repeat protein/tRNA A-37 threonylcarbamoyl transferase component Bud32